MSILAEFRRQAIGLKGEWTRRESYSCSMGIVERGVEGDWIASVWVGSRLGMVKERFDSAEVAMGVVERVWHREEVKRNGAGQSTEPTKL